MNSKLLHAMESLGSDARDHAVQIGRGWTMELRASLLREKRPASGGWPGTLAEARMHVARAISTRALRVATFQESEGAARIAYASARRAWLESSDADDEL